MGEQAKSSEVFFLLVCIALILTCVRSQTCSYTKYSHGQQHTACLAPNTSCTIYKSGVTAADKDTIVRLHNEIRSNVATGKQTGADGVLLPSAQNMRQLTWNDELAKIAQQHTDQCGLNADCFYCHSVEAYDTGEAVYYEYLSSQPQRNDWAAPIKYWAQDSSKLKSVEAGQYTPTSFTQMIWALTKDVGCGFTRFAGNYPWRFMEYYTCIYGRAGNYIDQPVYEAGSICADCSYKNTCCNSTCDQSNTPVDYNGLCKLTTDTPACKK